MRFTNADVVVILLAILFAIGIINEITGIFFGIWFVPYWLAIATCLSIWLFPPSLAIYALYRLRKRKRAERLNRPPGS